MEKAILDRFDAFARQYLDMYDDTERFRTEIFSRAEEHKADLAEYMRLYDSGELFNISDEEYVRVAESMDAIMGMSDIMGDRVSIMAALLGTLPEKASILYSGCKLGIEIIFLMHEGLVGRAVGFDPSQQDIMRAGKIARISGVPQVEFHIAPPWELPCTLSGFDVAFSMHNIQLWKGWKQAVLEMVRVTKPGGSIVIAWNTPAMRTTISVSEVVDLLFPLGVRSSWHTIAGRSCNNILLVGIKEL